MKTPAFWNEKNLISGLLLPLSVAYETGSVLRRAFTSPVTLPVPVVCVGGLTAGGAGKTPVALHIGKLIKEKGIAAFYLSRGYKGRLAGPVMVEPDKHTALDVGDEPLLLAQVLPTIVARDRLAGARLAMADGAKAIIMDDGFQNPAIAKTLSLVVIDGKTMFGNGRLIPAGPLRENPDTALTRAHAVITIDRAPIAPRLPSGMPVLFAKTHTVAKNAVKGKKLVAFCGIATPQKFFSALTGLGVSPAATIAFPDHHRYTHADWSKLAAKANKLNAGLVTTAKDAARLAPDMRSQVSVVDITLSFENPVLLEAVLNFALKFNENA